MDQSEDAMIIVLKIKEKEIAFQVGQFILCPMHDNVAVLFSNALTREKFESFHKSLITCRELSTTCTYSHYLFDPILVACLL